MPVETALGCGSLYPGCRSRGPEIGEAGKFRLSQPKIHKRRGARDRLRENVFFTVMERVQWRDAR